MPAKKPVIQVVISNKNHEKIKWLAEQEETSISQISATLLNNAIKQYESENGTIDIKKE